MDELREPTEAERERDIKFLTHIILEIRDYARSVGQEPDETLKATAEWILGLLQIATFNGKEAKEVVQPDHDADVSKKVAEEDCISRQAAVDGGSGT